MSYGCKYVGKKADVAAAVQAHTSIPENVKKFIVDSIATIPDPSPLSPGCATPCWNQYQGDMVVVEAAGHEPGDHTIMVRAFVSPPPAPQPAPQDSTAAPSPSPTPSASAEAAQ